MEDSRLRRKRGRGTSAFGFTAAEIAASGALLRAQNATTRIHREHRFRCALAQRRDEVMADIKWYNVELECIAYAGALDTLGGPQMSNLRKPKLTMPGKWGNDFTF